MPVALLPKMPGASSQAVAPGAAARPRQHQLLPRRLHPAARTQPPGTDFTQARTRPAVRCQFPDPARSVRRSQTPGRRDWVPLHSAHMGIQPAATPSLMMPGIIISFVFSEEDGLVFRTSPL